MIRRLLDALTPAHRRIPVIYTGLVAQMFERIPPAPDARTATRASRALNARRRKLRREALIAHIASFGPAARGLDRLKEGNPNV